MRHNPWAKWNPKEYLEEYHAQVAADTESITRSLIEIFNERASIIDSSAILDFGCGPTLYGILPIGHYFNEIYMADYLSSNLIQLDKWIKNDKKSFNWNHHTQAVLEQSGFSMPSNEQIAEQENGVRDRIRSLLTCDARNSDPIGKLFRERFPVVMTLFCADSITSSKDEWQVLMKNISSLVAPMGILIVGTLLECQSYKVKGRVFPSANILIRDIDNLIKSGLDFSGECIDLKIVSVPEHQRQGYEKLSLTVIQKLR